MQDVVRTRLLLFILGLIVVPTGTFLIILFAKGYRPNLIKGEITVTGLLVANSYPDSAQVFVNGDLRSATNTTLNLEPGTYQVEIKKEGFLPWHKQLIILPEIVTRATAVLFPSVPTLKPITSDGASRPTLSPDGTKIAYLSRTSQQLFLLDLNESPLGLLNREVKLLADFKPIKFSISNLQWSPDSRQILVYSPGTVLTASSSAYTVDAGNQQIVNVSSTIPILTEDWIKLDNTHQLQKYSALPPRLQDILATSSANIDWSPRENKLLYTATSSAVIPVRLKSPLAGSNIETEERTLIPNHVYIYDIEEDKNFFIDTNTPKSRNNGWMWFPTSSHIYQISPSKIIIKEYDNTNISTVYTGPLISHFAFPYPSAKQMLLLTNLAPSPGASTSANLYALTLR